MPRYSGSLPRSPPAEEIPAPSSCMVSVGTSTAAIAVRWEQPFLTGTLTLRLCLLADGSSQPVIHVSPWGKSRLK